MAEDTQHTSSYTQKGALTDLFLALTWKGITHQTLNPTTIYTALKSREGCNIKHLLALNSLTSLLSHAKQGREKGNVSQLREHSHQQC